MPELSPPFRTRTIFVQIKAEPGAAYAVAAAIVDTVEETSEVHSTSGAFDLLAKFVLSDEQDPGRFVTARVQTISGVRDTYTLLAFNAFTPDEDPA